MNQYFTNNISNEQVQLVNILEQMYYDNIFQINEMTNSINNVRNTNTQIRNQIIQILNQSNSNHSITRNTRNTNNTNNTNNTRNNTNNTRNNTNNTNDTNNVRNNTNDTNNVRNNTNDTNNVRNNTNDTNNVRNNTNDTNNVRNNTRNNVRNNTRNNVRNNVRNNTINNVRNNTNDTNEILTSVYEILTNVSRSSPNRIMFAPYDINSIQQYTIPSSNEYINRTRIIQNFLEPIEVCPTQSQIEAATRNVQYCDIINPSNRSCPISLETFNDIDVVSVIRFCGHIFNLEQLNTWFGSKCTCPICRYDIRNYNSSIITQETTLESIHQIDISDNIIEENVSSIQNEERISNTRNLDFFFDYTLYDDNLTNEFSNILDNPDAIPDINTVLSIFNNVLRK
jgi:hypothetical protein